MAHELNPELHPKCANPECSEFVTRAGRRPKDGKRYCMAPACQSLKQKERYKAQRVAEIGGVRMAPLNCKKCGKDMTRRPFRAGDELGRWCKSPNCRADRDHTRLRVWSTDTAEMLEKVDYLVGVVDFLGEVIMADSPDYQGFSRRHCPDCGLTTAIPEWVHPSATGEPCMGTLDGVDPRRIGPEGLSAAWPFRREYVEVEEEGDGS